MALLTLVAVAPAFAVQILVKGVVTDENTGEPMSVEMEFKDSKGREFKIRSNSVDGTFSQVVESGETYEVMLNEWDVFRKETTFRSPDTDVYIETEHNFTVVKMNPGAKVATPELFAKGEANFSAAGLAFVKDFGRDLRFNRSANFAISVNAADTYDGKSSSAAKALIDKRIATLETLFENEWRRYSKRIDIKADYSGSCSGDAVVTVTKLEDAFK